MKVTAFITSLAIVGSEAFAPGIENTRSSTGECKTYELQLELISYTLFREDTQQSRKIMYVREYFILGPQPTTEIIVYCNCPSMVEENEKNSNIHGCNVVIIKHDMFFSLNTYHVLILLNSP